MILLASRAPSGVPRAAETHVAGRAVGRVRAPGGHAVAVAVGGVAQVRAASDHLRLALWRPDRVRSGAVTVEARVEPVAAPLPHVARGVVQPVAVGREGIDSAGAQISVLAGI